MGYNVERKSHLLYDIRVNQNAFNPEHRQSEAVTGKHKTITVTAARSKTITLISCVDDVEQVSPLFFVFRGARVLENLLGGASLLTR